MAGFAAKIRSYFKRLSTLNGYMRNLKVVVFGLIFLASMLALVGFLLPQQIEIARGASIKAPPETIFAMLNEPKRWKEWSSWSQREPTMPIEYSGPTGGVGAKWSWNSKEQGEGSIVNIVSEAPTKLVYEMRFGKSQQLSRGEFILLPATSTNSKETRVVWTMYADAGANPFYRWMSLLADRFVGPDFVDGLANLKKLAEST